MKVKYIKIKADLNVKGVFNYNGPESREVLKNGQSQKFDNHIGAKKDGSGRDFTSSRCLRHHLFSDLQPRQAATAEIADFWVATAGSEIGLIRGMMDPKGRCGRRSPLHVQNAYTSSEESKIFFDQGSSSKPLESHADGSGDTSLFSKDSAPERVQAFEAVINIKELQFINLEANFVPLVKEDQEEELKKLIKKNFNFDSVTVAKYRSIGAVIATPIRGILFSDKDLRELIKKIVSRIKSLEAYKTDSSISIIKDSIKLELVAENGDPTTLSLDEALKAIDDFEFQEFYEFDSEVDGAIGE